jgi:hypothetical protein
VNKNPHVTPMCKNCVYENEIEPAKRPCYLCIRQDFMIDSELCTREFMAHYKEYFEENKKAYSDCWISRKEGKKS